ncbi:hypothetical protein MMC24_002711 [Lignoscripta atroalba]|nr:hypothetical protein [Lignoscripta atroalba]
MPRDPLIGLVGKPSSGKSTTLNRCQLERNFPFTTIDPQRAIGYLQISCACARFNLTDRCKPNYGSCVDGKRSVPIELLDVAGLVPGAHEGKGLGNKFLDDLRHADALVHVVDVSGTTDAEECGDKDPKRKSLEAGTNGYGAQERLREGDLSSDVIRALSEATAVETLQNQFSGYGSTTSTISRTLDKLSLKEPLEAWSDATISLVVNTFTDEKFPTVIALNKIDHPDSSLNITRIAKSHPSSPLILCSAISEVFLRRLRSQSYIRYTEGSDTIYTRDDLIEDGDPSGGNLKELDEKLKTRIENLRDMVLFRFGSTGVVQVLSRAADMLGLVPVFPVRNVHGLGAGMTATATVTAGQQQGGNAPVFRDCVLVKKGTTVKECARKVMGDAPLAYVEGAGGVRVSEDEVVGVGKFDPFRTSQSAESDKHLHKNLWIQMADGEVSSSVVYRSYPSKSVDNAGLR